MSKARDLANFISNPAVEATEIANGAITESKIANTAVTADKLHTILDLSSKTLTFANNHLSGDNIHGGVISDFESTGIDDNATNTAITIATSKDVTFTNNVAAAYFTGDGSQLTGLPPGYTNSDVAAYLANNDYDTATNIIAEISNSAPTTLNTLNELAAALGDDANFATTTATNIGTKLAKSSNLSDLTNAATARTNLGLGTAATTASTDYATAAQGTKADSAVQNLGDLGITSTAAEINKLDGVTATTAELNKLDGVTATTAELNILDGITATTVELNYVDGVTSNIQTQLNSKGTSNFSGAYADLSGQPTIPTNNNQLTNGAGYITSSALSSYATSTDLTDGTITKINNQATVGDSIEFFQNDGGGNLGIRFNANYNSGNFSVEDGSAWEFQFNNDVQNGDFVIYYDGSINAASESITWTEALKLNGTNSSLYIFGDKVFAEGQDLTQDLTINKTSAKINFKDTTTGGPHGLDFYDTDGTLKWGHYYRTSPDTLTWELNGSSELLSLDTSGNLALSGNSADLNLRTGTTGQTAFINWQFNTTSTNYIQMGIDYDTRASTGWFIDSGYPITIDYTTSLQFKASGTNTISIDSGGNLSNVGVITATRTRITGTGDVTLSSTNHGFQVGPDSGVNIAIDGNEMQARNNGAASTLHFNLEGGTTRIGGALQVDGNTKSNQSGFNPTTSAWATGAAYIATSSYGGGLSFVDGSAGFSTYVDTAGTNFRISQGATSGGLTNVLTLTSGGSLTTTGEINAYDGAIDLRNNGIFFESGNHCITWNDGKGNFNIRIGHSPAELCTEAGYVSQIEWSQGSGWMQINASSASRSVGDATSFNKTWQFTFSSGDFSSPGNVTAYSSDSRLKLNKTPIQSPIEKIKSIGGYTFDWDIEKCDNLHFTPGNVHEHGVIAQEIQKVIPDAVVPAPFDRDDNDNSISGEEYLTVRYDRIVPLLIEAIKEQQAQIEELKKKIQE